MQLTDYSNLRSTEAIEIPLNGIIYRAIPDPPGALVLAQTTIDFDPDLIANASVDGSFDQSKLTPEQMAGAIKATASSVQKNLRFLDQVLEPDSADRWRFYFTPLPDEIDGKAVTKKQRDDHRQHRITAAQMGAVIRDLVQVYGGRPTQPSSTSSNGDGGSGPTSTAGAPAGA